MEKRIAASAAGLKELALLREKHQREVNELIARLSNSGDKVREDLNSDVPPPLPPRWRAPAPARLCHDVCDDDEMNSEPPSSTYSMDTLDPSSTFRRPRKISDSKTFTYPSPMHAILMQYPNSDTKPCVNEDGFLETTFPADGAPPTCGHCHILQKSSSSTEKHNKKATLAGLPPTGLHSKALHSSTSRNSQYKHSERRENVRNLSYLSEEGYFSCSESSSEAQTVCSASLISGTSNSEGNYRWTCGNTGPSANIFCQFKEELEHEDQLFV